MFDFEFQDHVTKEPVELPEFQFMVVDIDQASSAKEWFGVIGYDEATYHNGTDAEASFKENTLGLYDFCDSAIENGENCLVAESTEEGYGDGSCGMCDLKPVFGQCRSFFRPNFCL